MLLNATFLDPSASGGPETYLRGLGEALAREFPLVRLTVATTGSGADALRRDGWGAWAHIVALPCEDGQRLRRQFAEQALVPALARRRGADVVHSLASTAPIRALSPAVITLHDVTFLVRSTFGAATTWGMREVITRAARHADALITGSVAARDEICSVLHMRPRRLPRRAPRARARRAAGGERRSADAVALRAGSGAGRPVRCAQNVPTRTRRS